MIKMIEITDANFNSNNSNCINSNNNVNDGKKNRKRSGFRSFFENNNATIITVLAVILAIIIGLLLRKLNIDYTKRNLMYLGFVGDVFLNLLKCLVIPLIVSSLISSIGRLDSTLTGFMGIRALTYYFLTTTLAVCLGILLVCTVQPGVHNKADDVSGSSAPAVRATTTVDNMLDLVRNLFPANIIQATFEQYSTELKQINASETDLYKWEIKGTYRSGTNILGLIAVSLVFSIVMSRNRDKSKPVLDVICSFNEIIMGITEMVIKLTPIGVFFLILPRILEVKDLNQFLGSIGYYAVTVLSGILIHGFIVLPLIYFVILRKNPYVFIAKMSEALMTAFGTASSSATMPVTMNCLENKLHVDPRVANVLIPIGATVNMDGTALYEAVAAIFIAQLKNLQLSFVDVVIVSLTATAASIGAAGIPQAGLVTMVMVLNAIGLPANDVSLIFAVDWLLDRFRTMVNVLGDSFGAVIVEHLCRSTLKPKSLSSVTPTVVTVATAEETNN